MFAPVTKALLSDAGIRPGDLVLDVATGAGDPALSVADEVGPTGKVIGIDPAPRMIEGARRAATQLDLNNTQFEIAGADALPFPTETFDAEVSRFGVMFFPSPVDGVREMLRVLKPGKKLSFAVWHFVENNPFHHALARIVDSYIAPIPVLPDAPDAFRFASPGKLRSVLAEAGAIEPVERVLRFPIDAPLSVEDFWAMRMEWSEKLREKLAQLPAEQLRELKNQGIRAFTEYHNGHGMSFPAEVLIVTGTKQSMARG
ncbi:MAG TPA: methyltransferase domain-containing protein [Bacteroidota bacterium]|nr:methyltransferase domain-containing protein [Bacteroidota bacterium]